MPQSESISLHELQPSNNREQDISDTDQDAFHLEQAGSGQLESKKTRARVLLGSAILQLPIWGMQPNLLTTT
jgi:hypothetical protein